MTDLLVGEIVDTRYELRRLIARGGMGLVFEGHHKFTRRTVALKILHPDLRAHDEAHGRLLREAHALTTVRHPGFVEVLDAGICAVFGPYVVLEMLEGRTLEGILAARRRLSIESAVQLGRQVCDAVAHANARGVVHRDIKPSNIFVARSELGQETVKIIDLGVAALAEGHLAPHEVRSERKLTSEQAIIGTPEYMAPEQLLGHPTDARTDVYAIGLTLYECLTGEVPYAGTYPEVLVRVSNATEPPSVRGKRAEVPPAVAFAIEMALEKEPGERFRTAAELGRALLAASGFAPGWSSLLSATPEQAAAAAGPPVESERPTKLVRQFMRGPYVTPVRVGSPTGSQIDGRTEEISEEGMLVVAPVSLPLGAPVTLRFASPTTGDMVVVSARVRWTREGRERTAMGMEFINAPAALRVVLARYIASLSAAQPG